MKKIKVAVLCGGFSSEREVSLKTGRAIYDTLLKNNEYETSLIDVKKNTWLKQLLKIKNNKTDIVFIALHGRFGEDGKIQSVLDFLQLKYTGTNALSSAIAMNKILTKKIFNRAGIPTPEYFVVNIKQKKFLKKIFSKNFPLVVKPSKEGSAIGVSVVKTEDELNKALKLAFKYDDSILVEKYISGRELSVPILGDKVLPIIEIKPNYNIFYDYESKYKNGGSTHIIPANLSEKLYNRISNIALKSMKSIGCEVMCRVDVILDKQNNPYFLEINTIPGMTETSLFPESAKKIGIDFYCLLNKIICLSFEKYKCNKII